MRAACLAALGGFAATGSARAQDTHYWTYQFGAAADLLGGMVVGDVLDLSATFYNPGGLGLYTSPSLILSAKGYEYTQVRIRGEGDRITDLNSNKLAEGPGLFAGSITFDPLKANRFAYSFLTRQDIDLDFEARGGASGDVLSEYPGVETYGVEMILNQGLTEVWGGLTWARALTERLGVGVTTYLAYRTQKSRSDGLLEVLSAADDLAVSVRTSEVDYHHARLLWKAGGVLLTSPVSVGLTVTTPSLGILGSGRALVNRITSGIDLDGDDIPDDAVTTDYQEDVKATIKSPLSIALGVTWTAGKTKLYTTAEWFDAVGRYDVLETKPFVSQSEGDTLLNEATHAASAVLNAGLGVEQMLSDKTRLYGAFRTDFSSFTPYPGRDITFSTWDIYHLSAGSGFAIGRFELTLGFSYSFGSKPVDWPFESESSADGSAELRPVEAVDVAYRRFKVLAGLNVGL